MAFHHFLSIVVFRCLRYAGDLLHFVSEILSEDKTNLISGTFHFFSNLLIEYLYVNLDIQKRLSIKERLTEKHTGDQQQYQDRYLILCT